MSDPMAAPLDQAERARDAVHDRAVRHAQLRARIATTMLRAVVPNAARIAAHIDPGTVPSISDILDGNGAPVPESLWVDDVTDIEEQLSYALDYCDPETAGWNPDDGDRRFTLPLPPRSATHPFDTTTTAVHRFTIQVDTANPHAWQRLTALLADPAVVGRDDAAGLHTTSIAVVDAHRGAVWDRRVDCTEREVLAAELAHIVRVYRQDTNPEQDRLDRVDQLVLALTLRLLQAVGIEEPDGHTPVSGDRFHELVGEMCGLLEPPPHAAPSLPHWVAEQTVATCRRVADQWLAILADRASEMATIYRDPTCPSYVHAYAQAEHARTTWSSALSRVRHMVHVAASVVSS